jgi:outer membrane receptor protein involved in Fe transport
MAFCLAALACICISAKAQERSTETVSQTAQVAAATGDRASGENKPATGKKTAKRDVEIEEIVVEAKKPLSAASSDEIRARDYELRPHATTQEILNNVPGLIVAQHQGGGKATQYLIRGFDADHGTDFAVFVDDLPVNLPTHAHGQGYADLNFLIPETVDRLQLYKGPYFAQFGDFANAGALNIVTKDEVPENYGRAEGGSFDTQRYVAVASPQLSWAKSLIAAQAYFSNGPFVNGQHYARYNFFSKFTLDPTPDSKLSVSAGVYEGDWDGSGQIPLRVVDQGSIEDPTAPGGVRRFGRFDAIDPTEGGASDRENLNLHYTYTPSAQEEWAFQVYASRYKLQLFTDFTFFKDTGLRFVRLADGTLCDTRDVTGACGGSQAFVPGDGIEQNDQRQLYGARAKYTRYWSVLDRRIQSQIAVETRNDDINVALHRQVQRQRFFTINQLHVEERSLSGYTQQQIFLTDWIRLEGGLRGDVYFVNASNRLPAGTPTTLPDGSCNDANNPNADPNFCAASISGTLTKSIVSPKVSLIITPVTDTDVYLNYGNGFHSNDARDALTAKMNPTAAGNNNSLLTPALGYELGARTHQFDRLDVAAALWLLDLESELVFSGDAGAQETGANGSSFQPAGPTRRWGVDFEARYQLTDWLFADYDLSWSDPRFLNGDAIPLAPTLLMNGGLTADFRNGFSAAFRMRYLGDRPAIEDRSLTARGYALFDLLGKYRWRNIEASLAFLNLTNTDWREAQFNDNSCTYAEVASGAPGCGAKPGKQNMHPVDANTDIHFTPGNPFNVRGGLTVYF